MILRRHVPDDTFALARKDQRIADLERHVNQLQAGKKALHADLRRLVAERDEARHQRDQAMRALRAEQRKVIDLQQARERRAG
jgi:predicted  nucleic acid-binding Zn-ribbon protein